jgi:hypothetical protein
MNDPIHRHALHDRFDPLLLAVSVPGRYAAGEFNVVRKPLGALRLRHGLAHPDLYEPGFGDPELNRLYHQLNRHPDVAAERVFLPDADLESALRAAGLPLFTLESRTPLAELDIVQFSVPRPRFLVNLAPMLELGGIPPRAADRTAGHPLVLLSGAAALAPEAVADLVDLVLAGETEDVIEALVERWRTLAGSGLERTEIVFELACSLDGAYAPAFYRGMRIRAGLPEAVIAARVTDFERAPVPTRPLVAGVRTFDEAMHIEIGRGADPGRSCLDAERTWAMPLAPARFRSTSRVLDLLEAQYGATGHEDIVLAAARPQDHPDLAGLVAGLRARFRGLRLHLRVPGLPVGDQADLLDPTGDPAPGPSGTAARVHVWPEECTPALRRLAGDGPQSERVIESARVALRKGFVAIEMHAVVGVPGESEAELIAIGALARELAGVARGVDRRNARVELMCAPWIPRPHTEHEGEAIIEPVAYESKLQAVRRGLGRRRDVRIRAAAPDHATLDAILGRADRNLAAGLLVASRQGLRVRTAPGGARSGGSIAARLLEAAGLDPASAFRPLEAAPEAFPWRRIRLAE